MSRALAAQTVRALNRSGFAGGIYPVNPKYAHIDDRRCYASVAEIPGDCDLAVIALPAAHVARTVRECGERGIRYAVVLGGGFREIGEEVFCNDKTALLKKRREAP